LLNTLLESDLTNRTNRTNKKVNSIFGIDRTSSESMPISFDS